jgi:hypothetical protein
VQVLFTWVVAVDSKNEIGGDKLRALVQQLEERVLGVGGWLAKENWTGCVVDIFTVTSDGFAIGLHGKLLKVGWEAVQVLIESRVFC